MYAQLTLKQAYWYAILHFRLRCPIPIRILSLFFFSIWKYVITKKGIRLKLGKILTPKNTYTTIS